MACDFPVRNLLRSTVAGLAALALSAGLGLAQDYKEAPMLAELVGAGTLPPVAERLPEAPMVVEPFEGVGEYGGTWRLIMNSPSDVSTPVRTIGYENFTRWKTWMPDQEQADIVPDVVMNVAESVDVNEDASEYTFHLRPGHEMVRRRRPIPPTTSCSGTRTSTRTPKCSPRSRPGRCVNEHPARRREGRRLHRHLQVRRAECAPAAGAWRRRPTTSSRT